MGDTQINKKSSGKKLFYRFHSPADKNFPTMLELFSKVPDSLEVSAKDSELTPIPVDEEISSLSAILLDSAYYDFIHQSITIIDNLPIIGSEILIPLKAIPASMWKKVSKYPAIVRHPFLLLDGYLNGERLETKGYRSPRPSAEFIDWFKPYADKYRKHRELEHIGNSALKEDRNALVRFSSFLAKQGC